MEVDKCKDFVEVQSILKNEMSSINYHQILESRSVRLQNRVSPILKVLNFESDPGAVNIINAVQYFKRKDGIISSNPPLDFLDSEQRDAVEDDSGKIRPSLYKVFLFIHVANALKSGMLNLKDSYKYRPLSDYIISKDRWDKEKDSLLIRAGLEDLTNCSDILSGLDDSLYEQFKTTNKNVEDGKNNHLKFYPNGGFRIATPALEEKENEPLQSFFPAKHFIPLTEVLFTVNEQCGFLDEVQHWQQRHAHKGISKQALFACLMGLGCGIGTRKMAQISSSVKSSEIECAVNWYFSLENIQAANDKIVKQMDEMELPNIYRRFQNELHTSSDGQKFAVRCDSLNANYSFKYFGKEQGVCPYTFIDERGMFWHSTVISSADRESAYVIDGLMHNDVIKSDIHSTDTHGYTEAIFAATYLLGFTYAPRIKNLKKQTLYLFKSRKGLDENWSLNSSKYVKENVISENWDDILRLICTIKLKETTASDIFKRLNSYSKQHDLYKALKAFWQIIKTSFILRYLDDVELRQSIEKQLNKVELGNKLTRAVAVGSPREFIQGIKEEQEIAEACNRLIKNAIICWNYMYLTKKLKDTESEINKEILLTSIKNHSPISWAHINLLGEYDFSMEKLKDSVGILPPKKSNKKIQ